MKCLLLLLFFLMIRPLYAQEVPGLVGSWKMNSACAFTDAVTSSPANGVLNDISLTDNKENVSLSAMSFNLNTSYITMGAVDKLKLANDKSISFWVRPVLAGANRTGSLFAYGTGIIIRYQEQSGVPKLVMIFGNTTYIQVNLTANQWQQVTVTFKKDFSSTTSKAILYVAGAQVSESEQAKTAHDFTNSIAVIGPSSQLTLTNGFRGALDEMRIYDRVLAPAEVLNLALPVTLEYFRGKNLNGSVALSWKTQTEDNVSHFEAEKSTDAIHFNKISKVEAGKYPYLVYDLSPRTAPVSWYRLVTVDRDGKRSYSNVIKINTNEEEETGVVLFPNPGTAQIYLTGAPDGDLSVVNSSGTTIRKIRFSMGDAVDISSLAPGLYYIIVHDGKKRFLSKFIKR